MDEFLIYFFIFEKFVENLGKHVEVTPYFWKFTTFELRLFTKKHVKIGLPSQSRFGSFEKSGFTRDLMLNVEKSYFKKLIQNLIL